MSKAASCRFFSCWVCLAGLLAVAVLLPVAGCGVKTGPTQQLSVNEPLTGAAVTDVNIAMGAGNLSLSSGGSGLVSGTISYNVSSWKPSITRTGSSVAIKQGDQKGISGLGGKWVNNWSLNFGNAPMRLNVTAGAYRGDYKLGGVVLQGLSVKDGASKTTVAFDTPNPGQMDLFSYETGASTVTMTGLANANFQKMQFKGGAGSYSMDFSGSLRSDASVNIEAGVGSVQIIVPKGMNAQVKVSGALTDISVQGGWSVDNKVYSLSGSGKHLTITVKMSVGSLKLISQ